MDVLAQHSGIASLVVGACGTAIAFATIAIRLVSYVFKKRRKLIEPVRRLLRHLHETAPRENDEVTDEIETLERLEDTCESVAQTGDFDAGVSSLLILLSPSHACKVLQSAHWLVESYSYEFESMREQKQWIGTGACVHAVSMVAESVISIVEFVHKAFQSMHDGTTGDVTFTPVEVLEKIYTAIGDGSLNAATANEVLKQLVIFLGAVIRFDKTLTHDTICPERYTLWPNEEADCDMSIYLVKVRDEIRDVLAQEIRPYRLEGAKTRRAAIIQQSVSSSTAKVEEPSKKRQRTMDESHE